MRKKAIEILKNTLIAFISVLVLLFVLEGVIRTYSWLVFPKMMVLDQTLGWRHAPNAEKIFINEFGEKAKVVQNAFGHRGQTYIGQKKSEEVRILVLGDSFTEGVHVSENDLFSRVLERLRKEFQVINAGVGGYSTVQEFLYLQSQGIGFQPDLVVLMVFVNDLVENCFPFYPAFGTRPYATFAKGKLTIISDPIPDGYLKYTLPVPYRMFFNNNSFLYYFINSRVYQPLLGKQMQKYQAEDTKKAKQCGIYKVFFGIIKEMKDFLDTQNVPLAMVLIPTREDVSEGRSRDLEPIVEFCRERGFNCLELMPFFQREIAAGGMPYFPVDIHWTKDGHRIVAEEMSRFLDLIVTDKPLKES